MFKLKNKIIQVGDEKFVLKSPTGTLDSTFEIYKTVKEEQMFMIAMKALQEAMAKIETLETKVAALEAA